MTEWQTIRRSTGLIEHVRNGVGHPNHASAERMNYLTRKTLAKKTIQFGGTNPFYVHGCNGDCGRADFPGNTYNNIIYAIDQYIERDLIEYLREYDTHLVDALFRVHEWAEIDVIEDDYLEQIRSAELDLIKLRNWLKSETKPWHDNLRKHAEFLYWPLKALIEDQNYEVVDKRKS